MTVEMTARVREAIRVLRNRAGGQEADAAEVDLVSAIVEYGKAKRDQGYFAGRREGYRLGFEEGSGSD